MELLSTPCFVRKLDIVGNRRTKRALIEAELRAALAARTHEDLAVELALASPSPPPSPRPSALLLPSPLLLGLQPLVHRKKSDVHSNS